MLSNGGKGVKHGKPDSNTYREHCRQTETWQNADGRVGSLERQAAAGMMRASCGQTTETPVHTDCCESTPTTEQSHAVVVLGRAAGMLSGRPHNVHGLVLIVNM